MRGYVAGPMRGYADHNFPAFHEAAKRWRGQGWTIYNPAEHEDGEDHTIAYYMRKDLPQVCACDAIFMLPGWQRSEGAKKEKAVAEWCGLQVLDAETGQPIRETVLEEANRITSGDRNWTYGSPAENHGRTAEFWEIYLKGMVRRNRRKKWPLLHVSRRDVCQLNSLQKISRDLFNPVRDNPVDQCGYARNIELCEGADAADHGRMVNVPVPARLIVQELDCEAAA